MTISTDHRAASRVLRAPLKIGRTRTTPSRIPQTSPPTLLGALPQPLLPLIPLGFAPLFPLDLRHQASVLLLILLIPLFLLPQAFPRDEVAILPQLAHRSLPLALVLRAQLAALAAFAVRVVVFVERVGLFELGDGRLDCEGTVVVEFERPARRARGGETDGERLLGALELRLGLSVEVRRIHMRQGLTFRCGGRWRREAGALRCRIAIWTGEKISRKADREDQRLARESRRVS